jgi:hypothetical protein
MRYVVTGAAGLIGLDCTPKTPFEQGLAAQWRWAADRVAPR